MSASHLLSETEAQRFAEYLERDAHDRDAMAKQMELVGMPKALIEMQRGESLASAIVARRLRNTERVEIKSE